MKDILAWAGVLFVITLFLCWLTWPILIVIAVVKWILT